MKRIDYRFKFLSLVGILSVVCGHCGSSLLAPDFIFLYDTYHIPLFLFISGYFYEYKESIYEVLDFIKKRFKRLVLPLWTWTFIYAGINIIIKNYSTIPFTAGIDKMSTYNIFFVPFAWGYKNVPIGFNIASWFIGALFLSDILINVRHLIIPKKVKRKGYDIICFFLATVLMIEYCRRFGAMENGVYMFIFFRTLYCSFWSRLGYFYRNCIEKYEKTIPDIAIFFITIISYIIISIIHKGPRGNLCNIVYLCEFRTSSIEVIYIALIAILFWLRVGKHMEYIIYNNKIPLYIANNTFDIMMHHGFVFYLINSALYFCSLKMPHALKNFDFNGIWYVYLPEENLAVFRIIYLISAVSIPLIGRYMYDNIKNIILRSRNLK